MLLKFKEGNRVKIHNDWLASHKEAANPEFQEIIKKHQNSILRIINSDNLPELLVRVESEEDPKSSFELPEYGLELV